MAQAYRRQCLARRACAVLIFASSASAFAASWVVEGRVVGISDGDTITVLDSVNKQRKVRIDGIDAPEKGQAFGERSRQSLAQMAHGKDVRLECHKVDRFGREVCKVWVQPADCPRCGKTLDVGLAQISVGLAWWFRRYADEQSAEDRGRYGSEEDEARLRKRGPRRDTKPNAAVGLAAARSRGIERRRHALQFSAPLVLALSH
jgi:endonuclease YncB( thermonuclease family)